MPSKWMELGVNDLDGFRQAFQVHNVPGGYSMDDGTDDESLPELVDDDSDDELFDHMGAHEVEEPDFDVARKVFQIKLAEALKTKYKQQVEEAAMTEIANVAVKFGTTKYLKKLADREPSIHETVLPVEMIMKDKRDSNGELLLFKGRLATGGHLVNDSTYGPFDKTSPTASIDMLYIFLAMASKLHMNFETCDVPSAYLNAKLPKGKKHVVKIKPVLAKYFCRVDPSAKAFLQSDGSLLAELLKALYGLPEAGKLWHELIVTILKKIGYEHHPIFTVLWVRIVRKNGEIVATSYILIYVDDFAHIWKGIGNAGKIIRDQLHRRLVEEGLPPLKCHALTMQTSVSFLGMSIQMLEGWRYFVSQPGYTQAIIEAFGYERKRSSPLPSDFNSRKPTGDDAVPITAEEQSQYRKQVMSIAWLVRTRIDIALAVAHKQTRCVGALKVDLRDLDHIMGYLASTPSKGIIIHCTNLQLCLYVDVGHATHPDMKSHTGSLVTCGEYGKDSGVAPIMWSSNKQKVVTLSSTSAELVGVSDKFDKLQTAHDLFQFLKIKQVQPYKVFQDNTSTITIAYLGRPSAHANRRFLEIRFFWFKEFLESKFAQLEYLPSDDHPADVLASVRSGAGFKRMINLIMGLP